MDLFVKGVASAGDFLAHALAIEREAAERYREFAQQMLDHGNGDTARLFERLASREAEHARRIERRAADSAIALPNLQDYAWFGAAAPESAAHEFVFRLMTAADALKIALAAERRAQEFFERVGALTGDPEVSALASEFAVDEAEHVEAIAGAIAKEPDPNIDWDAWFGAEAGRTESSPVESSPTESRPTESRPMESSGRLPADRSD